MERRKKKKMMKLEMMGGEGVGMEKGGKVVALASEWWLGSRHSTALWHSLALHCYRTVFSARARTGGGGQHGRNPIQSTASNPSHPQTPQNQRKREEKRIERRERRD